MLTLLEVDIWILERLGYLEGWDVGKVGMLRVKEGWDEGKIE